MSGRVKSNLGTLIRHEIAFICSENMVKDYSELVHGELDLIAKTAY